jgi:hypothetical protein
LVHIVPPEHLCPQLPQLSGSDIRVTHEPPHDVEPSHMVTHPPALQDSVAAHFLPHIPQFSGSLLASTHTPEQLVDPGGQPHEPALHS